MCIIIAKTTKTHAVPTVDQFRRAMEKNPHGFALVYEYEENKWASFKTMDKAEMLSFVTREICQKDWRRFMFHARYATHGSKSLANCHGFSDTARQVYFMHNGILPIKAEGDLTDSETFFKRIFVPLFKHTGWRGAKRAAEDIIGSSRFAFVIPKHVHSPVKLMGNFIFKDGISYSNEGAFEPVAYIPPVWTPPLKSAFSPQLWEDTVSPHPEWVKTKASGPIYDAWENEYWERKAQKFGKKL